MQRINKATIIGTTILSRPNECWIFEHQYGRNHAVIFEEGWNAAVWTRRSCEHPGCACSNFDRPTDAAAFLEGCRASQRPFVFDLWVNRMGKVLSAEYDGTQFALISFKSGIWETVYFDLPPREPPSSAGHVTIH